VTAQVAALASAKTFAYVAHEAVHGPLEVPARYINEECSALVPASHPTRLIYCGMVRAVDESVLNITQTYEKLGILEDTLIVLTTDNGGTPKDGGNNYPLRGNKATPFEGGVRGLAFVSGAGLAPSVRGTVSNGFMHVVDWLPTLAGGMAGLDVGALDLQGRSCPTCTREVVPLDGMSVWGMLSRGEPSPRKEALLHLQSATTGGSKLIINTTINGQGAIRVDEGDRQWKLLRGHLAYAPAGASCVARTGAGSGGNKTWPFPPIQPNESSAWCPFGWTPRRVQTARLNYRTGVPTWSARHSLACCLTTLPI
jgi:arylsulfatase B/arylsulfatase I/J